MKILKDLKPILAITKSSLISMSRNPSSIFFGILFPIIFILIFGFLGSRSSSLEVGITKNSDKNSPIYKALESSGVIEFKEVGSKEDYIKDLKKGEMAGVIDISTDTNGKTLIDLKTSAAEPQDSAVIKSVLETVIDKSNIAIYQAQSGNIESPITYKTEEIKGREYKSIDFILPGQLGFSMLNAGVFGTAFLFVSLRDTLVIKRYFATPIKKSAIVLGEAIAKLLFAVLQASIIIGVGYFLFDFTLIHGIWTFLQMIALSSLGLIVFLGFGFVISSIAKNENVVPPLANLATMPQFLLGGTFFPVEVFPSWLQPVSRAMPLTFLNDAMRKVAFDGLNLWQVRQEIFFLLVWAVIVYAVAVKFFKWEN